MDPFQGSRPGSSNAFGNFILRLARWVLLAGFIGSIAACTSYSASLESEAPTHTIAGLVAHDPPLFDVPVRVEGYFIDKPVALLCPTLPDVPVRVKEGECLALFEGRGLDAFPGSLHRKWVSIAGSYRAGPCEPDMMVCLFHPDPRERAERAKVFRGYSGGFQYSVAVTAIAPAAEPLPTVPEPIPFIPVSSLLGDDPLMDKPVPIHVKGQLIRSKALDGSSEYSAAGLLLCDERPDDTAPSYEAHCVILRDGERIEMAEGLKGRTVLVTGRYHRFDCSGEPRLCRTDDALSPILRTISVEAMVGFDKTRHRPMLDGPGPNH